MDLIAAPNAPLELRLAGFLSFAIPILSGFIFPIDKSGKYRLRVTPPPIFFAIWGLIYLNFLIACSAALVLDCWRPSSWILFASWNVVSGFWSYFFSVLTKTGVFISTILIVALLLIMEALWSDLVNTPGLQSAFGVYTHNTFALCVGWLCAACNLSLGIVMVFLLGLSFNQQLVAFWILTPLTYELFFYHNFTTAHAISNIGMVFTALYACTGAAISSLKPWPRPE